MEETGAHKGRWKLWLNIFTIVALIALIVGIHKQIFQALDNLRHINLWVLALIIPIEALNYHAQTRFYQRLFGIVGNKLGYWRLFAVALELNFINHVFPSAGVSGLSYFGIRFRREGLRGSRATLVQAAKLLMLMLSFEVLLVIGMIILAAANRANDLTVFIGTLLCTLLVVATFLSLFLIGSRSRISGFFTWATKALNRVIHVVRPRHPETINIERARETFEDFHTNYVRLRSRRSELVVPFWYGLLMNITEVLAVYVVYVAFGHWVNLGAVILAYAVANFAGVVSVLPGGIGVYEGLMTAVLATAGISPALSLPITLTYRIVNTVLQVPPGYVLYQRAMRSGKGVPPEAVYEQ